MCCSHFLQRRHEQFALKFARSIYIEFLERLSFSRTQTIITLYLRRLRRKRFHFSRHPNIPRNLHRDSLNLFLSLSLQLKLSQKGISSRELLGMPRLLHETRNNTSRPVLALHFYVAISDLTASFHLCLKNTLRLCVSYKLYNIYSSILITIQ